MDNVGIDLHKRNSQICILNAEGDVLKEQRIGTTRDKFTEVFVDRAPCKVLIESSGESEWVAQCIEALGHEGVVVDPGFEAMYMHRRRHVKTDRRDARTLADACRLGVYRRAHRLSAQQRHMKASLAVRETLVRARAKFVVLAQALVRRTGMRVRSGNAESFAKRVAELDLPQDVAQEIIPLLEMLEPLNDKIAACDAELKAACAEQESTRLLMTMPGVGPVTAAAFVATIDDPQRFDRARQVPAYLGLVPKERSSGERRARGRITKAGDRRLRSLLVEAALRLRRMRKRAEVSALVIWSDGIAERRGKKVAVIALARRLAGILYAMMRDRTSYPFGLTNSPRRASATA